jgi:hypothetical protein
MQVSDTAADSNLLFPGARRAKTKLGHEELSFITVQGGKFHSRGTLIVATAIRVIVYDEIIDAACFGGEMSSGGLTGYIEAHKGLPIGAEVMLSGANGDVKVGIGLGGADPIAVETKARRRSWETQEVRVVLEEVDKSLAWLGPGQGVLRAVGLHIELGVFGAAAGRRGRLCGSILREGSCSEYEKKKCRQSFHMVALHKC